MPNHVIDYDSFLPRLVAGLRAAWTEVRDGRPSETFYMFGIETDSDITDLNPLCSTEEEYRTYHDADDEPSLDKWFYPFEEVSELFRAGRRHTDELANEVNRYVFEDHSAEPEDAFDQRKHTLLQIFEEALKQLDAEGFFGTGEDRRQVLLTIQIVDADDEEWEYMVDVVRRINPPESIGEFLSCLEQAEAELAEEDRNKQSIMELASAYLRRQNQQVARCVSASPVRNAALLPYLTELLEQDDLAGELWQVIFYRQELPSEEHDAENVLTVVVDPQTGRRAIQGGR